MAKRKGGARLNGHNSSFSGKIEGGPLKNKLISKNQVAAAIKATIRDTRTINFQRIET